MKYVGLNTWVSICLFFFPITFVSSQSGNVGIGTTSPTEKLDVNGAIRMGQGANESPEPGTVRYNPSTGDFEGYNGSEWKSLTRNYTWGFPVSEENQEIVPFSTGRMGHDVDLSGNFAIVGDPDDNTNGNQAGAAFIYEFVNGEWELMEKIFPNDPAAGDLFGYSVSLSGNLAMIGAPYEDQGALNGGATYVFYNFLGDWSQADKFLATDPVEDGLFGYSVSLQGETVLVGAPGNLVSGVNSGAAYLFQQDFFEVTWSETAKLFASGGDADPGDAFGYTVNMKDTLLIIGALSDAEVAAGGGAAYIFKRNPDLSWSQQSKLIASDAAYSAYLGESVSIDGNRAAVGNQVGSAYVFYATGPGSWVEEARITSPKLGASDGFGRKVAISGPNLVISAYSSNGVNSSQGCAYVFGLNGNQWSMVTKLAPSYPDISDAQFGYSVDIEGDFILIGAPYFGIGGKSFFFQR